MVGVDDGEGGLEDRLRRRLGQPRLVGPEDPAELRRPGRFALALEQAGERRCRRSRRAVLLSHVRLLCVEPSRSRPSRHREFSPGVSHASAEDRKDGVLLIGNFRRLALALLLSLAASGGAAAQTNLRIGLAEDPDVLDPTLARTYVGRIVFASLCDKLFDIDAKLNIVPQLALSHETSADGKTVTIKLRPGVKFHDGEPLDAAAAKYSLDRHLTMKGSYRRPDLGSVAKVEVLDPLTIKLILKEPFSPLLPQLTNRAGMMVSPKAPEAPAARVGLHPGWYVPS